MQRGVSAAERVRIRAAFEEQCGDTAVAAVRRQHERADAVGLRIIRVGARFQQQARRLDVAGSRREQQRRRAAAQHGVVQLLASRTLRLLADDGLRVGERARADVGARLDEHLDDLGMLFGRGPHQRGLVVLALLRVHIGAASEQRFHRAGVTGARAGHQHRLAVHERRVRIGACREEPLDHCRAAIRAGELERCRAEIVRDVRTCTGSNQDIGHRQVVTMRRPVERRRPVALRRVHVKAGRARLQQLAHRFDVFVFDRLDQPRVASRRDAHDRSQSSAAL